jgi:DNA polymerase III sliding clamp (beta) subunit (PCNA family)
MLKELKFVQGAVAKKDFEPTLTHFHIKNNSIKGTNGSLTLCAPVPLDIEVKPKAIPFVKAIQACKSEVMQLSVTPTGRLSIKAGKFKALIECTDQPFPDIEPEGDWVSLEGIPILPALKTLLTYTGEDASRKWSQGVLLRGNKAFATNNIILMEYDLGVTFPVELNVPKKAIAELIRIGAEPLGMKVTATSVTFMYGQNHWVRTQLYDLGWPDLENLLSRETEYTTLQDEWFDSIETLAPFVDDFQRIIMSEGMVSTRQADEAGASVEIEGFNGSGVYNYKYFMSLRGVISHIDFSSYPMPCLMKGDKIRGVLMGMRLT